MSDPIRNRSIATRIVDEILADVMDRRGLEAEWGLTPKSVQAEIRETLIGIATGVLNETEGE
jgi:hypothetical protein